MANREVLSTRKDAAGVITHLCGDWGEPIEKRIAMLHIFQETHRYFVRDKGGFEVDVKVVSGPRGPYLRAYLAYTEWNLLDDLNEEQDPKSPL